MAWSGYQSVVFGHLEQTLQLFNLLIDAGRFSLNLPTDQRTVLVNIGARGFGERRAPYHGLLSAILTRRWVRWRVRNHLFHALRRAVCILNLLKPLLTLIGFGQTGIVSILLLVSFCRADGS